MVSFWINIEKDKSLKSSVVCEPVLFGQMEHLRPFDFIYSARWWPSESRAGAVQGAGCHLPITDSIRNTPGRALTWNKLWDFESYTQMPSWHGVPYVEVAWVSGILIILIVLLLLWHSYTYISSTATLSHSTLLEAILRGSHCTVHIYDACMFNVASFPWRKAYHYLRIC